MPDRLERPLHIAYAKREEVSTLITTIVSAQISTPAPVHKGRCETDHSTFFYYTEQGLSFKCRHCKGVTVIPWEEVLTKYHELQNKKAI